MNIRTAMTLLTISAVTISFAQSGVEKDSISLKDIYEQLPEVVVKGGKPLVKLERGKIIYNMSNILEKMPSDNAFDAIKAIPGMTVAGEELTFTGSNLTLLINGKPTTQAQEQTIERLKNMPSEQLHKAELTLAAPARYHARGVVLNVVTKDYAGEHHSSGQLQGTLNQSRYARGYGKGTLLHANGNITLDLNYAYTHGKVYAETEHDALHPLHGNQVVYHDKTHTISKGYTHDFRAEVDYHFAQNHTIDFSYTGKVGKTDVNNKTEGNSVSEQDSKGYNYLHNFELNYNLPFGLHLSSSYTYYQSPRDQLLDGKMDDLGIKLTANSNQTINKWLFSADQDHDLGKGWELNYGLKYQRSGNNSYQSTTDSQGNVLPEATSSVDIGERIFNGYVGFSKQIGQSFGIDCSLTLENYHTTIWNDWRLYPSLNATWSISLHHLLNLSLSSDVTYPSYWSTMNQVFYSSPYNEIWGNSMLKPSRNYNTSLTWQINRKYTFVVFANMAPDDFVQLPFQPSDRIAVIMKEVNFDYRHVFGLQAMAQLGISSWLNGNAYVTGFYSNDKCHDFFILDFNRKKFSMRIGANATMALGQKTNLRLVMNPVFQSNAIQGVYDIKSMFTLNASLRWISVNGNWNAIASALNLTNRRFEASSTVSSQNFKMRICHDWTTFAFTVIYKFGKFKNQYHKEIDTSRFRQ